MAEHSIYDALLAHEGIAIFEFHDGAFSPLAPLPDWCRSLWPTETGKSILLGEKSAFLEAFFPEAEDFWNSKAPGRLDSGNWIERDSSGKEIPLEASAITLVGKRVLLLRNLSATFAETQGLYQTARDSALAHERLLLEIQKKEILLHCIIHDLSQPLASMRGCFDLLDSKKLAPDIAKLIQTGQRESQRQERTIQSILEAFSNDLPAEQVTTQATAGSTDMISCARRAVEQFAPAFKKRNVRLSLAPYVDTLRGWRVVGDGTRLDRIFGNLLENALSNSANGSSVTAGVKDEGPLITAFVEDEGPGLAADSSRDDVFGLFDQGKRRAGKGNLGLYFCKMTIERWGGRIGAENRPDGGSRFWFSLPSIPD